MIMPYMANRLFVKFTYFAIPEGKFLPTNMTCTPTLWAAQKIRKLFQLFPPKIFYGTP
jgi:hypothetical protein